MPAKSVLLLGGSGQVGLQAATYLLNNTSVKLILASRKNNTLPAVLTQFKDRVSVINVDALDTEELSKHIIPADLVVTCIGPSGIVGDKVILACKATHTPVIDAGGYDPVYNSLHQHESKQKSTVPLIFNVGLLPGLSGTFPHYLIQQQDSKLAIEELELQYIGRDAWSYNSAWDIIYGLGDFGQERGFCYYQNNTIKPEKFSKASTSAIFPAPIGKVSSMLLYAEEIVQLAKRYKINTAKVYGANVGPRAMFTCLIAKVFKMYRTPKSISRAAKWLVKASAKDMKKLSPVFAIQAKLTFDNGQSEYAQIVVQDTYQATGYIIGITAKSVLENKVNATGPLMLHQALDPKNFIEELKATGIITDLILSNKITTKTMEAA
ncbi:NAD(P)H-binding protein [Pseudoalteromonas tunicata]|uniref:saccharopine dehydrogenase NADP-binding domain-containing protein n=1 Tax=Pseudoalteromonas tunicata TaxID=314281 RepID=UPI00273FC4D7|nr:NAD(P)H-binding protein [Pseudoalteromonas tunicata]MDP5213374.1 NAD(P)H-binding protein [Pseudoalteromonas tunicata]